MKTRQCDYSWKFPSLTLKKTCKLPGYQKGHGPESSLSGDAYRMPPIVLDIVAALCCTLVVFGLIGTDVTQKRLIIETSCLTTAMIVSLLPMNIVFLSRAEDVDSICFRRRHFMDHAVIVNCCMNECTCNTLLANLRIFVSSTWQWFLYAKPERNCSSSKAPLLRLLCLLVMLLVLSGDVETNPGPQVEPFTMENVLNKLTGVTNLKRLGVWLNVPSPERGRLQTLVGYFVEVHPFGSWRTVIWALDAIGNHDIADTIRDYAENIKDPTFTTRNVHNVVTRTIKGWYGGFGDHIAVPWTVQDRIKLEYDSIYEQKKALVEYWVNTLHDASWSTLAGVLYLMDEKAALHQAMKYLESFEKDSTLNLETLTCIFQDVEDWDKLGYYLDVPWSLRAKIENEHVCLGQRKSALLSEWLQSHPAPTWQLVGNALSWMGKSNIKLHTALKSVYSKYLPDPDDRRLVETLHQAVEKQGYLKQTIVQLNLCGTARSGKTSLIRRLMGKKAREDEPSTGVATNVVRVDIVKNVVLVDKEKEWKVLNDINEESSVILNGIRSSMSVCDDDNYIEADRDCSLTHAPTQTPTAQPTDSGLCRESLPRRVMRRSQIDASIHPVKIFEYAIKQAKKEVRLIKDPVTIYITDMGGQHEFQELIPALVSGPSIFLLVVPAHWGLNNAFPVEYLDKTRNLLSSYKTTFTLKEYVLQTISTLSCIGTNGNPTVPKVVFILTFKDKVTESQLVAVDKELQDAVMATEAFVHNMIEFASEHQLCYSINNLSDDNTDVAEIRKKIERIAARNDGYTVYTPYTWQFFGVALRWLEGDIVHYSDCQEVGKRCGIHTKEELDQVLSFFHRQTGIFRYFGSVPELGDIVFKNPQVLFDRISELVVNSFTFQQVGKQESDQYNKKGIFSSKTLESITPSRSSSENLFTASRFLAFLKHHSIVAPLQRGAKEGPDYFLPCALVHTAIRSKSLSYCTEGPVQPLLIVFDSGYIPTGLFGFMVVDILGQKFNQENDFDLQLVGEQIYRNQITLSVGPYIDTVQLSMFSTYIRIDYIPSAVDHEKAMGFICSTIKDNVRMTLMRHRPHYNRRANNSLGLICQHSSDQEEPHPAIITFLNNRPVAMKCTLQNEAKLIPSGCKVWFDRCEPFPEKYSADFAPRLAQLKLIKAPDGEKIEIIKTLAPNWKMFGIYMDFDPTGNQLNLIQEKHRVSNPEACCTAVFEHWLQGNGKTQTWETLIENLGDAGYSTLAHKVEKALEYC